MLLARCRWCQKRLPQLLRPPWSRSHPAAAIAQLCSGCAISCCRPRRLQAPSSKAPASHDHQNSQHATHLARCHSNARPHLPLEVPAFLFGGASVAGYICSFVETAVAGPVDLCRYSCRPPRSHRRRPAGRHPHQVQRHFPRGRISDASTGHRGYARARWARRLLSSTGPFNMGLLLMRIFQSATATEHGCRCLGFQLLRVRC